MLKLKPVRIIELITMIVLILATPLLVNADTIIWDTGTYRAYGSAGIAGRSSTVELFSPPLSLPLSAEAHVTGSQGAYARSDITNSSFYVTISMLSMGDIGDIEAIASFNGTFTAPSSTYIFSYDMWDFTSWGQSTWITVRDLTSGTDLINSTLQSGANYIDIATQMGHSIEVDFGISQSLSEINGGGYTNLSFDRISIVPEPVSSILFVTGGTLLASRRFIKRKKTA